MYTYLLVTFIFVNCQTHYLYTNQSEFTFKDQTLCDLVAEIFSQNSHRDELSKKHALNSNKHFELNFQSNRTKVRGCC